MFKGWIEWLEVDNKRLRKVLAIFTAFIWLIAIICSYVLKLFNLDTIDILTIITGQFAVVIGFYMTTKAESD